MWIRYADVWIKLAVAAVVLVLGVLAASLFVFSGSDSSRARGSVGSLNTPVPAAPTLKNVSFSITVASASKFAWPAEGTINRYFGTAGSTGIDIGLNSIVDSPIRASAAGRVTFAAGDPCCEYGRTVIIDHGSGLTTLYGHLSEVLVVFGQEVKQGDFVGIGGSTGNAPSKQLHFEVAQANQLQDPLRYLSATPGSWYSLTSVRCPSEAVRIDAASTVTLTFLPSSVIDFRVESVQVTVRGTNEKSVPMTAQVQGPDSVALQIPEAAAANGELSRFELAATLRQGEDQATLICVLELTTKRTLANSEIPVDADPPRSDGTLDGSEIPSPTVTPSATPRPATPTVSPAPSKTPRGGPTATPRKPKGLQTSTPRPRPGG